MNEKGPNIFRVPYYQFLRLVERSFFKETLIYGSNSWVSFARDEARKSFCQARVQFTVSKKEKNPKESYNYTLYNFGAISCLEIGLIKSKFLSFFYLLPKVPLK